MKLVRRLAPDRRANPERSIGCGDQSQLSRLSRPPVDDAEGHGTEWLYLNSVQPGSMGRWVRLSGGGDTWFAEVTLTYADSTWLGVAVCETIGDRMFKETIWYCPTDILVAGRDRWSDADAKRGVWHPGVVRLSWCSADA